MTLFARLKSSLSLPEHFISMSEDALQRELAPQLRAFAVKYLGDTNQKTPVAMGFRAEYLPLTMGEHYKAYLKNQAKNKTWGTYIEATALGEALTCNVFALPITRNGIVQKPICLYYAGVNAPTVSLYNSNNTHWSIHKHGSSTLGDGNCLYNAFGQALREAVITEQLKENPSSSITFYGKQDSSRRLQSDVIKAQQLTLNELKSNQTLQTPVEVAIQLAAETKRIGLLSLSEQEQIAKDYIFALELAKTDLSYKNKNVFHCYDTLSISAKEQFSQSVSYQSLLAY